MKSAFDNKKKKKKLLAHRLNKKKEKLPNQRGVWL